MSLNNFDNENNKEIVNTIKFGWYTSCYEFTRAPVLNDKLYKIQKIDGSLIYNQILKIEKNIEFTELIISENSIIRVMFISQKENKS